MPARLPRSSERTASTIVPLDAIRNTVKSPDRSVSSSTPGGGHCRASAFSVKYAANRPPKNMSSDASHTTVPTASMDGCWRVGPAVAAASAATPSNGSPRSPPLPRSQAPAPTATVGRAAIAAGRQVGTGPTGGEGFRARDEIALPVTVTP